MVDSLPEGPMFQDVGRNDVGGASMATLAEELAGVVAEPEVASHNCIYLHATPCAP